MSRRFCLILTLLLCADGATSSQTTADWEWMDKHFGQALDSLMPLQKRSGFYIAYRAHRDLYMDIAEKWFMIGYERNADGEGLQQFLSAHVRSPESSSIYVQLMQMHRGDTQEDISSMINKLRVKTWDSNERDCPVIRKEVEEFRKVQTNSLDLKPDH